MTHFVRYLLFYCYRNSTLIVLFCFLSVSSFAQKKQGSRLIDSLLIRVPETREDTNKVRLLLRIGDAYIECAHDSLNAAYYLKRAKVLAEKLGFLNGIKETNCELFALYRLQNNNVKAMDCLFTNAELCRQHTMAAGEAECESKIAAGYLSLHITDKALEYYFVALKKYEALGDTAGMVNTWYNLANEIYIPSKNYAGAVKYLSKMIAYYKRLNSDKGVALAYNALAQICVETKDYNKALKYYDQCYDIFTHYAGSGEAGRSYKVKAINIVGNIGKVHQARQEYLKAIECYNRCYNEGKAIDLPEHTWLMYMGEVLVDVVKDSVHNVPTDEFFPAGNSARLQKAIGFLDSALVSYGGRTEVAEEIYTYLSDALNMSGRYKEALEAYREAIIKKDSVFSADKATRLAAVDNKRVIDLKDKEIELGNMVVSKKKKEEFLYASGLILLSVLSVSIYTERRKAERERKRSDNLLLNILPSEVAEELKTTGNATARQFDNVTVLLTDFVDFTKASERMSPQELINELNVCFKAFDGIIGKYYIEKIKTIGDAYLAVAGLPVAHPLHAERAVRAALEICHFMHERRKMHGEHTFEVTVGLHSGGVIAGIVG